MQSTEHNLLDKFHAFHSIETVYGKRVLDKVLSHPVANERWVVLEKVHGCNFSMYSDGKSVVAGKRTTMLNEQEYKTFNNAHLAVEKYRNAILKLHSILKIRSSDSSSASYDTTYNESNPPIVVVYGELFGGRYPGTTNLQKPVQTGVWYSQHIDFYAFDIRYKDKYLDYDDCVKLFEQVGLCYAKPLFVGNFTQAATYAHNTNAHVTTIPQYFSLPPIENNIREGNVLKPIVPTYFGSDPVIYKCKNGKFRERSFSMEAKIANRHKKENDELAEELRDIVDIARSYIVQARYDNLMSKQMPITPERIDTEKSLTSDIINALVADALKDMATDDNDISALAEEHRKIILRRMMHAASKLVRDNFASIKDGPK